MNKEELTVEEALKELREMFPGKEIFLKDEIEWWAEDSEPCRATVLGIDYPPSNKKEFRGDSLAECVDEVRKWHKVQSQEQQTK